MPQAKTNLKMLLESCTTRTDASGNMGQILANLDWLSFVVSNVEDFFGGPPNDYLQLSDMAVDTYENHIGLFCFTSPSAM